MIENAAALLRDGEVVLVGVGLPVVAASLARERHAPAAASPSVTGSWETWPRPKYSERSVAIIAFRARRR
jgi:acyl CoA:acetate/3-ketoacid CoA transferase beta subunit